MFYRVHDTQHEVFYSLNNRVPPSRHGHCILSTRLRLLLVMISRDRPKSAASTGSSRGGRVAVTWALLVGTTGHQGHCKCTTPGAYLKVPQCSSEVEQCSAVWPPHPWRCWSHLTVRRTRAAQSLVQASASGVCCQYSPAAAPPLLLLLLTAFPRPQKLQPPASPCSRPVIIRHHHHLTVQLKTKVIRRFPKISQSQRRPLYQYVGTWFPSFQGHPLI